MRSILEVLRKRGAEESNAPEDAPGVVRTGSDGAELSGAGLGAAQPVDPELIGAVPEWAKGEHPAEPGLSTPEQRARIGAGWPQRFDAAPSRHAKSAGEAETTQLEAIGRSGEKPVRGKRAKRLAAGHRVLPNPTPVGLDETTRLAAVTDDAQAGPGATTPSSAPGTRFAPETPPELSSAPGTPSALTAPPELDASATRVLPTVPAELDASVTQVVPTTLPPAKPAQATPAPGRPAQATPRPAGPRRPPLRPAGPRRSPLRPAGPGPAPSRPALPRLAPSRPAGPRPALLRPALPRLALLRLALLRLALQRLALQRPAIPLRSPPPPRA
ncbi:proteophosphoglycan 5 [Actinosynnema pretiosum subsp. pretiosum]|nr:proteophosphoglycan 5 [Actinosynnema pretiosum subsp. pretiosum]